MIIKINTLGICFSLLMWSFWFSMDISLKEATVYLYGLCKPYQFMRVVEELSVCMLNSKAKLDLSPGVSLKIICTHNALNNRAGR